MKALSLLLLAAPAYAFPTGTQFDLDPMKGDGAGGIAFTGSPRFTGHACVVCHTEPAGTISLGLEADHPELFTDGYKPNMQYHLRVALENQHAGAQYAAAGDNCGFAVMPYVPCDQNGFALEMDDLSGAPKGKFVPFSAGACVTGTPPADVDIYTMMDGGAVVHKGAHHAQTQWDFCWTAPAAGTGALTAYVAIVDGNGGDGTMNFPADTLNDDTISGAVPLPEIGGQPAPTQNGGCSAGGDAGLAIALVALALLHRRRRMLALAVVLAASCTHVRPAQRETLARRNMKFSPDPTEDELDLHMQEAREGSSGGYGSSGGGCGCN